jgi:hypothetical protein
VPQWEWECRATEVCTTPKTKRLFSCYVFVNRTFVLFYNNIEIFEGVVNCGWRKLLDRNVKGSHMLYSYSYQRAKFSKAYSTRKGNQH